MFATSLCTELVTTFTNVLKTTTLIYDIASYMIDPRPWLIVFGKSLNTKIWLDKCYFHLDYLVKFFRYDIGIINKSFATTENDEFETVNTYVCDSVEIEKIKIENDIIKDIKLYFQFIKPVFHTNNIIDWNNLNNLVHYSHLEEDYIKFYNIFLYITKSNIEGVITKGNTINLNFIEFPKCFIIKYLI